MQLELCHLDTHCYNKLCYAYNKAYYNQKECGPNLLISRGGIAGSVSNLNYYQYDIFDTNGTSKITIQDGGSPGGTSVYGANSISDELLDCSVLYFKNDTIMETQWGFTKIDTIAKNNSGSIDISQYKYICIYNKRLYSTSAGGKYRIIY